MRKAIGFMLIKVLLIACIIMTLGCLGGQSRARESARRAACLNNLKMLIMAIQTYTPDYGECYPTSAIPKEMNVPTRSARYPYRPSPRRESLLRTTVINVKTHYRDLGILYPGYTAWSFFACPSSGDKMPKERYESTSDARPFRANEAKQVSYAYGYNGEGGKNRAWTEAAPRETRVLADRHASRELTRSSNHKMDGRNVAFADWHVKWVSGKKKLYTNPDHPDPKVRTQSWWSERP